MSSIVDRWLSQDSQLSHTQPRENKNATARAITPNVQLGQRDRPGCTEEEKEKESQRDRDEFCETAIAKPAKAAKGGALADVVAYIENASRGPCIRCGGPVTRLGPTHGFRNGFGDLVHLRCP
jgi:hypothetical protein